MGSSMNCIQCGRPRSQHDMAMNGDPHGECPDGGAYSAPQSGVDLIAAERQRQNEQEGRTPEHDAEHDAGKLSQAAACYALGGNAVAVTRGDHVPPLRPGQILWPFGSEWWKPKDRIRDLVRAGALIAAEIDRLQHTLTAIED